MKSQIPICLQFLSLILLTSLTNCSKSADIFSDAFNTKDSIFQKKLTIKNNEIICDKCDSFGDIVATYNKQIFVGELQKVWIFDYNTQGIALTQEIELSPFGFLNSIIAKDEMLYIGVVDPMGTGNVRQYSKNGAAWEFMLKIEIGREQDDFGLDMALNENTMVIGASARWSQQFDPDIADQGIFYVYSKHGAVWNLKQEFFAENSASDDRFGTDVAIWEDYIMVSGLSIPMQIYHRENDAWTLSSVENDIVPLDFANYNNTVIYFSEVSGLHSFRIEADGALIDIPVMAYIDLWRSMPPSKDSISMWENLALITTYDDQKAYLLRLLNDEWILEDTFNSNTGSLFELKSIELSEDIVLLAGTNFDNFKSHIYIRTY